MSKAQDAKHGKNKPANAGAVDAGDDGLGLVLSRQRDQRILIGKDIVITVADIRGDKVRLGIKAPPEISIHREEVARAIAREAKAAETVTP